MIRHSMLLLVLVVGSVSAETVYKSLDANGHVSYSDQPPQPNSVLLEVIELPGSQSPVDAQQQANQRIEQMAEVTERLQRDRQAREQARERKQAASASHPLVGQTVVKQTIFEENHYVSYPRRLGHLRRFPDIHRGRFPLSHPSRHKDLSRPPPSSGVLTPRSTLLTPK